MNTMEMAPKNEESYPNDFLETRWYHGYHVMRSSGTRGRRPRDA